MGLLDDVVQVGGRDHRPVIAPLDQEIGDRDRMLDELLVGLLAVLAEMDAPGKAQRGCGQLRIRSKLRTR